MSLSVSGHQAPMTRGAGPSVSSPAALRRPSGSSRPPTAVRSTGRCVRVQALQLPFGLNKRNNTSSSTSIADLMAAVDSGNDASVVELIESIRNPTRSPAKSPLAQGKWRLRWSAQAENANPLQKAFANQVKNFQILYEDEDGISRVENLVQFAPFLKIRAEAFGEPGGADRSMIDIKRVVIEAGPLKIPFKVERPEPGYVDWLYLDDAIRVTRGSKGSVFIHSREPESP